MSFNENLSNEPGKGSDASDDIKDEKYIADLLQDLANFDKKEK